MSDSKIVAYMWWCGDYHCDCTQPVVERITPRGPLEVGYKIERLWAGTFGSRDTERDAAAQWRELKEAASQFSAERRWRPEDEVV